MTLDAAQRRVAAALDAFQSGAIEAGELHSRLLKVAVGQGNTGNQSPGLRDLLGAVDEATDLGADERQQVAWAAASFWRATVETL